MKLEGTQVEQWYHANYAIEFDKWTILEKLEKFDGVTFVIGNYGDASISFMKYDKDTIRIEYDVTSFTMEVEHYYIDDISEEYMTITIQQKMKKFIESRIKDLKDALEYL
jgi:hypothetical protein